MYALIGYLKTFWVETVNTACYLVNHSPSTSVECKTPDERWFGIFEVFCCLVYNHVNDGKLELRAKKCLCLDMQMGDKVIDYSVLIPSHQNL